MQEKINRDWWIGYSSSTVTARSKKVHKTILRGDDRSGGNAICDGMKGKADHAVCCHQVHGLMETTDFNLHRNYRRPQSHHRPCFVMYLANDPLPLAVLRSTFRHGKVALGLSLEHLYGVGGVGTGGIDSDGGGGEDELGETVEGGGETSLGCSAH